MAFKKRNVEHLFEYVHKLCNTFEDGKVKYKTYQNQGAIKVVEQLPGQNFSEHLIPQ